MTPDRRHHRGRHPADEELFAPDRHADLRRAVVELSWLLDRGYADRSALELVGNRHQLRERQRHAVLRASCGDTVLSRRTAKELPIGELAGSRLAIDGYNLLITVESALAGGLVLVSRDGCYRDVASIHGTYRKVEETVPALERIGKRLSDHGVREALWLFDAPVSNSGRLRSLLLAVAKENNWPWSAETVDDPDRRLLELDDVVVVTSDSAVLQRCACWSNLAKSTIDSLEEEVWLLDLRTTGDETYR